MSESIANRVSRLISGGFNAVIDAMENASPEIVMQQAIREVDQAISEIRDELGKVIAGKHLASKRLIEETERHEKLSEQINLAVEQKRDDLAEAAISRQMDIEAQIPVLEAAIADAADREKELESYIAALKGKQHDMREELNHYRSAQATAASEQRAGGDGTAQTRADKATQAFERALDSASHLPGRHISGSGDEAKLAELEKLARENRIKERLAAAKAKQSS